MKFEERIKTSNFEPPRSSLVTLPALSVRPLGLDGVRLLAGHVHADHRGAFRETYSARALAEAGIPEPFVQDNQVHSRPAGVLRGLHFQIPPFAQSKLVRVLRGAIVDVVVDLRRASPTFGQHLCIELTDADSEQGRCGASQLYIPAGFAHGFFTLQPDTEVFYKVSCPYSPAHERGLRHDDPALGIDWTPWFHRAGKNLVPVMTDRDRTLGTLDEVGEWF